MQNIKIGKENVLNYLIVRLPILSSVFAGSSKMSSKTLYEIAQNPNISQDIIGVLSKDSCVFVRARVAENKNCTIKLLEKMSSDPSPIVRIAIARNKKTPVYVLKSLERDNDKKVRDAATIHLKNC